MKRLLLTIIAALTILFAQAQQCQADFSYMQNGPTTVFTDLSTMQSTNYSATWQWDFGDGTVVEDVIVKGSGTRALATHKYVDSRPFPYRARLTVTGQSASGTIEGVGEVSVYVLEPKGWAVREWDIGESSKTAVRSLTGAGYVILSAIIWALVFSPVWLGVVIAAFFLYRFIRKKKRSGSPI